MITHTVTRSDVKTGRPITTEFTSFENAVAYAKMIKMPGAVKKIAA